MPETPDVPFQELLLLDVALLGGHLDGREAAMVLLRWWDHRDRPGAAPLLDVLKSSGGLDGATLEAIQAEAKALVARHGDARTALDMRGGMDQRLRTAVARRDPQTSMALGKSGVPVRAPLRTVSGDRYLDYMPVGQGGMGVVYWALDTEMNRQVAFKVVRPPGPSADLGVTPPAPMGFRAPSDDADAPISGEFEELTARFLMEAWITGGMEHPGIVPVYEVGRTEHGVPYYTMRFIRGQRTLLTAIRELEGKPMADRLALIEPFLRVCDTIRYAHAKGVIHRDLKPENIALGEFGEVVVLDWGLAKPLDRPDRAATRWKHRVEVMREARDLRTLTSAIGTPGYMAPEAVRGEIDQLDERSDVYALGVMLFQILTGTLPFDPRDGRDYVDRVVREQAPHVDSRVDDAPAALARLCELSMSLDPALRPADVEAFTDIVRGWQRDHARRMQIDAWLREGQTALELADGAEPGGVRRHLEVASAAAHRILETDEAHTGAQGLLDAVREQSAGIEEAVARAARSTLLRRAVAVGLLVVAVVGGVSAWMIEQRREEAVEARAVAEEAEAVVGRQRDRAEQTMDLMIDTVWEDMAQSSRLVSLVNIGEAARAHYAAIDAREDDAERFARRMRSLHLLAEVLSERGHLRQAREVLDEAASHEAAYTTANPDASEAAQRLRLETAVRVAEVDVLQGLSQAGLERAVATTSLIEQALDRAGEGAHELRGLLVRALWVRGNLYRLRREHQRALADARAGLDMLTRLPADDGFARARMKADFQRLLLIMGAVLAPDPSVLERTGSLIEEADALADRFPDDLRAQGVRADARWTRCVVAFLMRDGDTALAAADDALALYRLLADRRPHHRKWQHAEANTRMFRADLASGYYAEIRASDPIELADVASEYTAANETITKLLSVEDTSITWLHTSVSLCDRMANLAQQKVKGFGGDTAAWRQRAAGRTRRMLELDPDNQLYVVLHAFTMSVLDLEPSAENLTARREALGHARRALDGGEATSERLSIYRGNAHRLIKMLNRMERSKDAFALAQTCLAYLLGREPATGADQLYDETIYAVISSVAQNPERDAAFLQRLRTFRARLAQAMQREGAADYLSGYIENMDAIIDRFAGEGK